MRGGGRGRGGGDRGGGRRNGGFGGRGGVARSPSYLEEICTGHAKIDNQRAAELMFTHLLRAVDAPQNLALLLNEGMQDPLYTAMTVTSPQVTDAR